jgi:hypothetical protein
VREPTEAVIRGQVCQAVVEAFAGKPLDYKDHDCVRLAAFAVKAMGHRVKPLKGLRWTSRNGAMKALRRSGFADLVEAVDAMGFDRQAPAKAFPGDLIALEAGDGAFGPTLAVYLGSGAVLGFAEVGGQVICQPRRLIAAVQSWRVPWQR